MLEFDDGGEHVLPGAFGAVGVGAGEVHPGELQVEGGLIVGVVPGLNKAGGFPGIGRAEALTFSGDGIEEVDLAAGPAIGAVTGLQWF
ncbi:MAG: hypothetical protein AB7O66_18980 [Limisphaerales bacterium]